MSAFFFSFATSHNIYYQKLQNKGAYGQEAID